ncbi:hypothetical protein Xen7305DRAFT_00009040 [Xenococcus sp. PCC 7305]|uniref:hypothetical protein n=1 Tax=Xenococcus sp. PCC 7305 TaxID=102125 RepID=UPI0002AB9ADF|nr:hypothetical protein [Xenococcus sp. PCC 7305]ELS01202.1 hypothetical protein Xen7305DRAFT_00009040 [Xenococcus sp. PCC 7305]
MSYCCDRKELEHVLPKLEERAIREGHAEVLRILDLDPLSGPMFVGEYRWVGDPSSFAYLTGKEVPLVPWPLIVIDDCSPHFESKVVRTDVVFYAIARFQADFLKLTFWIKRNISDRILLTCMVWGLAYVPLGAIPSWGLHFGRRRK